MKHNTGVQWKQCPHCDYKTKENGALTKHKATKHNIGVQWKQCPDCDHKAKSNGNLAKHKVSVHNIGVNWKRKLEAMSPPLPQGEADMRFEQAHQEQAHVQVKASGVEGGYVTIHSLGSEKGVRRRVRLSSSVIY